SAGSVDESGPGIESVRYEDPSLGIYKKLVLRDNKLHGVILVGDTSDSQKYSDWLKNSTDLTPHRRHLLFPPPSADAGLDVAKMPENETICGCLGVTKGAIIDAIHEHAISTLAQLKDRTRASSGCGTCAGMCSRLLQAVAPDFQE